MHQIIMNIQKLRPIFRVALLSGLFALSMFFSFAVQAAEVYKLSVDEWDRPHDAKSVSIIQPLPDVIANWQSKENQNIEIRYPGGESGLLLATSLRDWLVVLGVPSGAIILTSGSADFTELELLVQ